MSRPRPIAMVVMVCLAWMAGAAHARIVTPTAMDGRLDLSGWSFEKGIVPLDGQWQLFWGHAGGPDTLAGLDATPVDLPGTWTSAGLEAHGRATYRLTVVLPPDRRVLAIKVPPIRTAMQLWIDGELMADAGRIGAGPDDTQPAYAPEVVYIDPAGDTIELVLAVVNYHHRTGGVTQSLRLGTADQVTTRHRRGTGADSVLLGALLIMGFYHLGLFVLRRQFRTTLYFALCCLAVCVRIPLNGEYIFYLARPETDLVWSLTVEYLAFVLTGPLFAQYISTLFPREWHPWASRLIWGTALAQAAVIVVAPLPIAALVVLPTQGVIAAGCVYIGVTLVRAYRRRREGALLFAGLFTVLGAGTSVDILYYNGVIDVGPVAAYGLLVFMFGQAFLLSRRFASAFAMAEVYAATFRKFVPVQFLRRIAKEGITSIRLGNVESDEITILFSDIRSFTTISESLSPDKVFAMLNAYLSRMQPPIRRHGGFVDKFIGDAIMALFDLDTPQANARGAVSAALGMLAVQRAYNAERRSQHISPIDTGIGIHSGEVMIGTVGSADRMDSTAIGDAVNLAARIEGMTKIYGASLLISDTTLKAMGDREPFVVRFVDRVRAKGKVQPVGVWQVLGEKGDAHIADFEPHLPLYEEALERYQARDFEAAARCLEAFLAEVPDDEPARIHLDRCRQFTSDGVEDDWDGVVSLTSK